MTNIEFAGFELALKRYLSLPQLEATLLAWLIHTPSGLALGHHNSSYRTVLYRLKASLTEHGYRPDLITCKNGVYTLDADAAGRIEQEVLTDLESASRHNPFELLLAPAS